MELSKRLLTISEMIEYKNIIDVGTDHCYLPIYMIKKGIINKAVAGDLNEGPLEKAMENAKKHNVTDRISFRLGTGLRIAKDTERQDWCAVIAGMGGFLINRILEEDKALINLFSQLILQPQSDLYHVRKQIHALGLKITDEKIVFDSGKYYHIISCKNGNDIFYEEKDYILGKIHINRKDPVFFSYIKYEFEKASRILNNIEKNASGSAEDKVDTLNRIMTIYKEVLV